MTTPSFLPYGRQGIDDDDIAAVVEVLRGDFLTTGPAVDAFEQAFAARVGAPHAVACANGTAALHMACMALGLGAGDAVIVPAVTFLATASAPALVGAEVVFADVDADTGLMTPDSLRDALGRAKGRPRAVFPVHLAGQCVDLDAIAALAAEADLTVVEDACHAVGAAVSGAPVGACAHGGMACFSFHPVKTMTTGEGGMVTTADAALADRLRLARNHGMTRAAGDFTEAAQAFAADGAVNPWYYEMHAPALNYRLTDIQAALGRSQLGRLDRFVTARRALVAAYESALAPLAPVVRPMARSPHGEPAWHLFVALIDFAVAGIDRATLMRRLAAAGIGTQVHYLPVNRQPYWRARGATRLPGADAYYDRCLSLPLFPSMTPDDVSRVVRALADALGQANGVPA